MAPQLNQPIPQPSLTVTGNKTQESVIINPTQPLANEKRKKQRFFWKVCPNCHRSFENLEKHLLSKRGACGKKPNGDLCTKAEAKEIHEKAKDELEERARDKSYFSTSELKAALLKSKTLHAFSRALTEMTGVYFDNRDVRDCAIQINEAEPAVPTVSVRHETPVAPPSDPAPSFSSMPERDCFSSEPLMGPSRPRKRVRWADIESNPEDSDVEGGVYDSFNIEDYRRLKDGVKNFMVPVLGRLSRNQLLDGDIPNLTAYLCFQVSFMFGHRPGVPKAMTIEEFLNRQLVEEEAMYVIPVENHKNASLKSAGIVSSTLNLPVLLCSSLVRLQAILKAMSDKRGLGTDISKNLTEEGFARAVRRLGYKNTLPSLVDVQQKYQSYRIKRTYPIEPVVDENLLECILYQSWIGLTLARSQEKDAGMGVYANLPFWENQVVVEYHGKRMATVEAKKLLQTLKGEEDGANYILHAPDYSIDARKEVCDCHPHQTCFGRSINHRAIEDGPNLKWKELVVENVKRPFLVARRDISAGEELCYDYGVRPGDFNEGQEMVFLLSDRAKKRRRDAAVVMENKKPKEVGDASSGDLKPRTAREQRKAKKKERRERRRRADREYAELFNDSLTDCLTELFNSP
ncbi:hypothetical protein QYM36_018125 [Artemia franciscana]|uniref:SET domain-containing protein n=1 Tax=Artemia franciscana TaxID=6661 RepID=A0AA88L0Q5_ARTSF|nr:hypothetical protein QYM36_018125 [Artemia franciscana]